MTSFPKSWYTAFSFPGWTLLVGHLIHKLVSATTRNVLSETLNPTIPYHTILWPLPVPVVPIHGRIWMNYKALVYLGAITTSVCWLETSFMWRKTEESPCVSMFPVCHSLSVEHLLAHDAPSSPQSLHASSDRRQSSVHCTCSQKQ